MFHWKIFLSKPKKKKTLKKVPMSRGVLFHLFLFVLDKGCYIKEERIITTTEAFTTTEVMKTTTCEPVKSNCSTLVSAAEEVMSTSCTGAIAACIVLAVIIIVLLVVLVLKFTQVAINVPCVRNSSNFFVDCNKF